MEGAKPAEKPAQPAATSEGTADQAKRPPDWAKLLRDHRKLLRWGVVGLAVVVGLIAWIVGDSEGDDGTEASATAGFAAKIVSEAELEEIAGSSGHVAYWAGPIEGKQLEASEGEDGSVQVRYLDEGEEPGSDRAGTLTIGSYPLADAANALEGFAGRQGAIVRESEEVGEVVSSAETPSSVYFASPDGGLQIEVYDPSPARAMRLALSGKVQPVG